MKYPGSVKKYYFTSSRADIKKGNHDKQAFNDRKYY